MSSSRPSPPHIDHWVIVDTGSTDGMQDLIRRLMAERGIPGELFERPWRNFGHNRTEALALAQGRAHYIGVVDADDTVAGTIDFRGLSADGYSLRIRDGLPDEDRARIAANRDLAETRS